MKDYKAAVEAAELLVKNEHLGLVLSLPKESLEGNPDFQPHDRVELAPLARAFLELAQAVKHYEELILDGYHFFTVIENYPAERNKAFKALRDEGRKLWDAAQAAKAIAE